MKSLWIWFFILCRERGGSNPYLMMSFIARFLWELAVKKAHGGPIAKLKLIKNRGQIMPPIALMKSDYYFIFNKLISYFIFYLFLFQSLN